MSLADLDVSDEATRAASLERLFASAPVDLLRQGLWLFVYGLLAADPPFRFTERRNAVMEGRRRAFVLCDPMNRGTPEVPGLVLGLEPGGACHGFAYRIAGEDAREALAAVWRQEMALPFYRPEWRDARSTSGDVTVLTMGTRPDGPLYRPGLGEEETARVIARAKGSSGSNRQYLSDSVDAFATGGLRDPYLDAVSARIQALAAPASP